MAMKSKKKVEYTPAERAKMGMVMTKLGNKNTAKYYAGEINTLWTKTAENYIRMGQLLNEAKSKLKTSEWRQLIDVDLAFDESKAKKLMLVAKHPLANEKNLKALPATYSTLYTLTDLDEQDVKKAIRKGDINPNMSGSDAKELINIYQPKEETEEEVEEIPIKLRKDEVEEADDVEVDLEGHEDVTEADDKPAPAKNKVSTTRSTLEVAADNLDSGIESLQAFLDNLEGALEKADKKPSTELKKKLKQLQGQIDAWLKNY